MSYYICCSEMSKNKVIILLGLLTLTLVYMLYEQSFQGSRYELFGYITLAALTAKIIHKTVDEITQNKE